jgi:hypothetical protein
VGSKKEKKEIDSLPIREQLPPIDKNYAKPCKDCRKRDSCILLRPIKEQCSSFDEGTPWSILYENSLPSLR